MDLTVKSKRENPALSRQEMECVVSFDKAVPSRKQLREAIAAATGADQQLLVIVSVGTEYGSKEAFVSARLYASKGALAIERRHLLVRDGLAEKKAKGGKKAAAPAKK